MSIPPPPGPRPEDDPYRPPQGPTAKDPRAEGPYAHGAGAAFPPPGGPYGAPGPGPYGVPPYQTWGQGYTPFSRQKPVNGVAIAALVLGVMCFLPAVGLVLGVIALVQIRKRDERGKPMAIVGAVLSALGLALWIVSLATGALSAAWDGFKDGMHGNASLSLKVGDCFDVPGAGFDEDVYDVDKVPCSGEHEAEVFATIPLKGSSYPGDGWVSDLADNRCWELRADYAMDPWAVFGDVDVSYLTPTRDSWEYGDHEITCVFVPTDDRDTLTGSLRADASSLDADQIAFLKAMDAVDEVLFTEPDDDPEEYLDSSLAWAGDVHDKLDEQIAALRAHTWSAKAQKAVDALVKDMEESRDEWGKAATAGDADTYFEHYDAGYAYVDGDTTIAVRKVLGLTTTPPSYDEGDDSGDSGDSGSGSGDGGLNV